MKKTYCDCCGDEMEHGVEFRKVNGANTTVRLSGKDALLEAEVNINFVSMRGIAGPPHDKPSAQTNGIHLDVCINCRWKLIDKLDTRPKEGMPGSAIQPMSPEDVHSIFHCYSIVNGSAARPGYDVSDRSTMKIYQAIYDHITGQRK